MKKWIAALLCAVLLMVGVPSTRAITVEDVYFTAVNISLLPLDVNTMPIWVGGQIYVPAGVFDRGQTGADLGVSLGRVGAKNTVILLGERDNMIFDLNAGTCRNQYDEPIENCRAVVRKGTAFLPLEQVCAYFGLEDSYTYTRYGYLVRVKTPNAPMTDEDFVEAAELLMQTRMKDFIQANTPPAVPPEQQNPPDVPQVPVDPPPVEPPANRVRLYLAFRCESGEGLESILTSLDRHQVKGLLLFTPEQMERQDDLVRRAVGRGHTVGILAEENAQEMLDRGNERLAHIARTAATVALVPEGQRVGFEERGWVCWDQTADGRPRQGERSAAYVQRLIQLIGNRSRTMYLTLDDSAATAGVLDAALTEFAAREYTIVTPLESRL
ncbi:MAG: hypothetical protein IJB75_03645 [Oscillospiraceae bacterium]|nr:hypothetical protein [Oscillospiraceae bacterium]